MSDPSPVDERGASGALPYGTRPNGRIEAPAIVVRGLDVRYGAATALRDVAFEVPPHTVTAVIGPSGCGKSTLLTCLNRLTDLVPGCRVTGEVRIGDVDVLAPATDVVALRRRAGMLFQAPNPFPMSIRRNLELPLREHGLRGNLDERIERGLRDVGLWDDVKDRLHRPATTLSGGQQQRLCLARALVLEPAVLLMDEPCSALDPLAARVVEDLILRLRPRYTQIVVTHNLSQARRLADDVVLLWSDGDGGRVVERGPVGAFFESPREELTAAYVAGRVG
jgi:phosphate transport system ATP-binding protein